MTVSPFELSHSKENSSASGIPNQISFSLSQREMWMAKWGLTHQVPRTNVKRCYYCNVAELWQPSWKDMGYTGYEWCELSGGGGIVLKFHRKTVEPKCYLFRKTCSAPVMWCCTCCIKFQGATSNWKTCHVTSKNTNICILLIYFPFY